MVNSRFFQLFREIQLSTILGVPMISWNMQHGLKYFQSTYSLLVKVLR